MSKKIIIDASRGGEDIGNTNDNITEKDFNLKISKYIKNKLDELNIENSLTREDDSTIDIDTRINKIKSLYGDNDDVIVLSNALKKEGSGIEIVYALRNKNTLSEYIFNELKKNDQNIIKYYQKRLPTNLSKDYNKLIRNTKNNETLIIYYGNIDNNEDLNNLTNNWQKLGNAITNAIANYLNLTYDKEETGNYYTIQSKDNLYSIAKKYNTKVEDIKKLNNLNTDKLQIGQILKMPLLEPIQITNNNYINYKVEKGDNLYSIANKYNSTTNTIKSLNNLNSNILSIGEILKIPTTINPNYTEYKVLNGDSLYSIAKKYNTTIDNLKELNNLNSNLLFIGEILKIPIK